MTTISSSPDKPLKYFDIIVGLFVAVLIISNVASAKIVGFGNLLLDGGTVLFPLAYVLGDVLTEVYGYARARRVIWIGFGSLLLAILTLLVVQSLPAASSWEHQSSYENILGFLPRIGAASLIAYLMGSFINAYVLAKLKVKTKGRHLWLRTISSTLVGQAFDTTVFSVIAFGGTMPGSELIKLILTVYLIKVTLETLITPLTYKAVNFLKSREQINIYDQKTDFYPLKIKD